MEGGENSSKDVRRRPRLSGTAAAWGRMPLSSGRKEAGLDKSGTNAYNSICDEMRNQTLRDTSKILKALSERNRLRILKMLEVRPMAVCEVREVLGLSMSTVSRHLAILREAGLILDDKDGKWIIYRPNDEKTPAMESLLHLLSRWVEEDYIVQTDREKAMTADRFEICQR
jgi:ArsR family transcriptional regulator